MKIEGLKQSTGELWTCSGVALGPRQVATAAHCLTDGQGKIDVLNAAVIHQTGGSNASLGAIPVAGWKIDESQWSGNVRTSTKDIALLKLDSDLPAAVRPLLVDAVDLSGAMMLGGWGYYQQGWENLPGRDDAAVKDQAPVLHIGFNHIDDPSASSDPWVSNYLLMDFDDYSDENNLLGEPGWTTYTDSRGNEYISLPQLDLNLDRSFVLGEALPSYGDSGGPIWSDISLVGIISWSTSRNAGGACCAEPELLEDLEPGDLEAPRIAGAVDVKRYAGWINDVIARDEFTPFGAPAVVPAPPAFAALSAALASLALYASFSGRSRRSGRRPSGRVQGSRPAFEAGRDEPGGTSQ